MLDFILGSLGGIFGAASFNQNTRIAKSEVISSLRNALRLTDFHIQKTRIGEFGGDEFSETESQELSAAWSKAAQAIRPFDESLANTFESKSDYWINPHGFRQDIVDGRRRFDYRLRLAEVKKELNRIERGNI